MLDHHFALTAARRVLAADCACDEGLFSREGVFVVQAAVREGQRAFPRGDKPFFMATMGQGAVVSCGADRIDWMRAHLANLRRDDVFSIPTLARLEGYVAKDGQSLHGPHLVHVCSSDTIRAVDDPRGIAIRLVDGGDVQRLYKYEGFLNALSYRTDSACPDVLAAIAIVEDEVVGIAGASADCNELWQIGIDVIPAYRRRGVGKALVHRLTDAIFARGKVPYYATAISNGPSRDIANSVGYWPCWVEVYTK